MSHETTIDHHRAHQHLREDSTLGPIVDRNGLLRLEPADDFFGRLCQSVVRQQISMHAADAIVDRLESRIDLSPSALRETDEAVLRDAGLSRTKASTLQALAATWGNHDMNRAALAALDDDAVVTTLTDIHGIGPWTAKMALLFGLGRPDVWPIEDLGIRRGMEHLFATEMSRPEMVGEASAWRPYRSVAALHLWQVEDE